MNYSCISDIGLHRDKNQDSYCVIKNDFGDTLAIVCDGIGGGKAGEVASGEVVKFFINAFKKCGPFVSLDDALKFLTDKVIECNSNVYKLSTKYKDFFGMGTTLTGLLFTSFGILSINVGDSRVYGFIDNKIIKLTNDHTLINEMLQKGEISYEQSLTHPKRHYLVKAIGVWESVEPDIHKVKDLDYYVICSDGLYNYIQEEDLISLSVDKEKSCEEKCKALVDKALLNGGYDNITIIVVDNNG